MSEVTLSVKGLRKVIGKREIIKNIDFELKRGEVFGFLGPNGAGKTTTIRMLVGLIRPTAGSISICGYSVWQKISCRCRACRRSKNNNSVVLRKRWPLRASPVFRAKSRTYEKVVESA